MHISNYQNSVLFKVKEIFPEKLYKIKSNYRPDFLKNPNTGKNLEIDIYICEKSFKKSGGNYQQHRKYRFGIEIQGEQHFKHVPKFQNDVDGVQYRDTLKQQLCKKVNFPIIEIFYSEINPELDLILLIKERVKTLPLQQQKVMVKLLEKLQIQK